MKHFVVCGLLFCLLLQTAEALVFGQSRSDASAAFNSPASRLAAMIESYDADRGILNRFYSASTSPNRAARFRKLNSDELALINSLSFDQLNESEQIDFIMFKNYLEHEIKEIDRGESQQAEMAPIIPFSRTISDLEDLRRTLKDIEPAKAAATLNDLAKKITSTQRSFEATAASKGQLPKRTVANRAVRTIVELRNTLRRWYTFYNGYDPLFTWWCEAPYKTADEALAKYQGFVTEKLVGIRPDDKVTIIGDPIGREALIQELQFEMIPYSPEELVEIANKEFAWCEAEMKKASREMGFGDDWKRALESVKQKYVEPGKQPGMIRDLAYQAIDFVEKNDLVTVPKIARDGWRMEMMTPERQLVAPFFLGGETILVAYPTEGMTHEQKMMSMRGNNPHFAHATVFHELIPGHHLQGFMSQRFRQYRGDFRTPFNVEGWALYWEFLLWDMGFDKTPEDRVGALFWRMHRCARIIFSLSFHLEKMTPQECVDFLVDRVGHERDNAAAEVRRSFSGEYGPLYQIAYMIGGFQFYNLHRELVDSKKMTNKQFHDAILREGPIPVEMIRATLTGQKLERDFKSKWRFYQGLSN
jgi:uncharacterized protein (DUF885 family)